MRPVGFDIFLSHGPRFSRERQPFHQPGKWALNPIQERFLGLRVGLAEEVCFAINQYTEGLLLVIVFLLTGLLVVATKVRSRNLARRRLLQLILEARRTQAQASKPAN